MNELELKQEFFRIFVKNGKLKENIHPMLLFNFFYGWFEKQDPQMEVLEFVRTETGGMRNILNYISSKTCGVPMCSDELMIARGLNRDSIVPYILGVLEEHYKDK